MADLPADHRSCCIATVASVGRLSVGMWIVVLGTVVWITVAGMGTSAPGALLDFPPDAFTSSRAFFFGLGGATLIAMYDYGGYNNVCFLRGRSANRSASSRVR